MICSPTASTRLSGSNGSIKNVCATTETFIKERTHATTGKIEPVKIDDACSFFCRF